MILGSNSEGGCPFVHHDEKKLILTLRDDVNQNQEAVHCLLDINKKRGPQAACQKYFTMVCETYSMKVGNAENPANTFVKENPVKFYLGHRQGGKSS